MSILKLLAEKQQSSKEELLNLIEDLEFAVESFTSLGGLSEIQAMYAVLHGDRFVERVGDSDSENERSSSRNRSSDGEDFEWVDNPKAWKPAVRKFCFKAGINSFKIIKSSKALTTLATSSRAIALSGKSETTAFE
jgi:hypothetical protein